MSDQTFLFIMLGVIVAVFSLAVPSVVRKRCPACKARNGLESPRCVKCGHEFPPD